MKTAEQLLAARSKIADRLLTPGLTPSQTIMLSGIMVALTWVGDGEASSTMERLLTDEPMAPPPDEDAVLERHQQRLKQVQEKYKR